MRTIKGKLAAVFSFLGAMALAAPETKADCTLTTGQGTNGRCFQENGEYKCLERTEDTNCYFTDAC